MDGPLELLSVEIYHADDEVLVTAIEILSPVNKQPGHQAYTDYLRKRRELLRSTAHLLEIDLLRGGSRQPLTMDVPEAPYYITLSQTERRPFVSVWPIHLQTKLPSIPIPLQAPDPDVTLNLSDVVAAVYERGGYDAQIRPRPSLPKRPPRSGNDLSDRRKIDLIPSTHQIYPTDHRQRKT